MHIQSPDVASETFETTAIPIVTKRPRNRINSIESRKKTLLQQQPVALEPSQPVIGTDDDIIKGLFNPPVQVTIPPASSTKILKVNKMLIDIRRPPVHTNNQFEPIVENAKINDDDILKGLLNPQVTIAEGAEGTTQQQQQILNVQQTLETKPSVGNFETHNEDILKGLIQAPIEETVGIRRVGGRKQQPEQRPVLENNDISILKGLLNPQTPVQVKIQPATVTTKKATVVKPIFKTNDEDILNGLLNHQAPVAVLSPPLVTDQNIEPIESTSGNSDEDILKGLLNNQIQPLQEPTEKKKLINVDEGIRHGIQITTEIPTTTTRLMRLPTNVRGRLQQLTTTKTTTTTLAAILPEDAEIIKNLLVPSLPVEEPVEVVVSKITEEPKTMPPSSSLSESDLNIINSLMNHQQTTTKLPLWMQGQRSSRLGSVKTDTAFLQGLREKLAAKRIATATKNEITIQPSTTTTKLASTIQPTQTPIVTFLEPEVTVEATEDPISPNLREKLRGRSGKKQNHLEFDNMIKDLVENMTASTKPTTTTTPTTTVKKG
jgi:hypothetical protein